MFIPSIHFNKICKEYQAIQKYVKDCTVHINHRYSANSYNIEYQIDLTGIQFTSVAGMYNYSKICSIPARGLVIKNKQTVKGVQLIDALTHSSRNKPSLIISDIEKEHSSSFKSLLMLPESTLKDYRPVLIQNEPIEVLEGDYTYRFIIGDTAEFRDGGRNKYAGHTGEYVSLISRNDEDLYDYLDKGFFIKTLRATVKNKEVVKHVVSPIYDVNAAHIFAMCCICPRLTELLQKGCFINPNNSELLRLKMYKKLSDLELRLYKPISDGIEADYRSNSTIAVIGKLVRGEVEKTTINNVVFTKNSATYEQVSIEAEGLLDVLHTSLNFNSEFDIYSVVSTYATHVQANLKLDNNEPKENENNEEAPAQENELDDAANRVEFASFKINNIEITPSVSRTYQRYINNIRINKCEIAQAIHRASCHHTPEDYKLFLKDISRMSIKWHDIISNGLPVKIHPNITREEYAAEVPGNSAPALKFFIDPEDKYCKMQITNNRSVRVHFGRLLKRVETLNKKTDYKNYYPKNNENPHQYYRNSVTRDYSWCAKQLIPILIECSTFKKTEKNENGEEQIKEETLITREDVLALLSVVNEQKRKVIERSKQFLETAIKLTKAEKIEFLNKSAYKVQGSLRTYAVIIENAKVYDYDTKQYRCIVNDRHYAGAGYDDIAARLLALKNDSMMQAHISTLKGEAQPNAENVHNDYRPERDIDDSEIASLVSSAFIQKNKND